MKETNTKMMFENLKYLCSAGYIPSVQNCEFAKLMACVSNKSINDLFKHKAFQLNAEQQKSSFTAQTGCSLNNLLNPLNQQSHFEQNYQGQIVKNSRKKHKANQRKKPFDEIMLGLQQEIQIKQYQAEKHRQQALSFLQNDSFDPQKQLKKLVAAAYVAKDYGFALFNKHVDENQLKLQMSQAEYQKFFHLMVSQTIYKFQNCLLADHGFKITPLNQAEMGEAVQLMKIFQKVCPLELRIFAKNLVKKYILEQFFQSFLSKAIKFHRTLRICLRFSREIKRQSIRKKEDDKLKQQILSRVNVKLQIVVENQNLKWTQKLDNDLLDMYEACGSSYLVCGYILRNNPHLGEIVNHSKIKNRIMYLLKATFSKVKFCLKHSYFPSRFKEMRFDPIFPNLVAKSEDYFPAQKVLITIRKNPTFDSEMSLVMMEELMYQIIKANMAVVYNQSKMKSLKEKVKHGAKFKFKRTKSSKFQRQKWKSMIKQSKKCQIKTINSSNASFSLKQSTPNMKKQSKK